MKLRVKGIFFVLYILAMIFLPLISDAAAFSYAVWIPYWRKDAGVTEVSANLKTVQEISPFSYEVRPDGTLVDKLKIGQDPWPNFLAVAMSSGKKIIPAIAWIDGEAILKTLASTTGRDRHIAEIVDMVRANNFAGIDIDYENKKVETRPHFSKFLKELSAKLHKDKKILVCSIESRTPISSRFVVAPKDLKYANDFSVIGQYCDEVRIMAYDQSTIDIKLNKQKGGSKLYAPVADADWTKKTIQEALKSISAKKIMLGIPTFGHEYEITPKPNGWNYQRIRSLSYQKAIEIAQNASTSTPLSASTTPARNSAGEMSFIYQIASSTRLVWFPDAISAQAKVKLAKQFKLRGIAIFKADGESDPLMWQILK